MAATQIGIVYATGSGILRRLIVPDDDAELVDKHPVALGETMLVVSAKTIKNQADVEAAVALVIGKPVPSARCAVVDAAGTVVNVIMADPALDSVSGATLVLDQVAVLGWKLVDGALAAPVDLGGPAAA
jgi:hypothetical protein